MRLGFLRRRSQREKPKDVRSALSQLAEFLEDCDWETEELRHDVAELGRFRITVVKREFNLGQLFSWGYLLICAAVFLAIGFAAGWYSDGAGRITAIIPEAVGESELETAPTLPPVPDFGKTVIVESVSSPDTLLLKVNDLLERVKRGE